MRNAVSSGKTTITKFKGGATRIEIPEAFEQICPAGEAALARIYAEGDVKYGLHNWIKNLPISNILRHMRGHMNRYAAGDRSAPHMAKVAWGAFAIEHFESGCQCHLSKGIWTK